MLKFVRWLPRLGCGAGSTRRPRSAVSGFQNIGQGGPVMISQTAEYALRAVLMLAARDDVPAGTAAIAESTRVPAGYLSKVLQGLARHGLVVSSSGRRGGFRLARKASEISVLQVIQAVAPLARLGQCPLGIESHNGRLCPLHRQLNQATEAFEKALAAVTIAQLLQEPNGRADVAISEERTSPPSVGKDKTGKP